jgi:hypothetical protein
MHASLSLMMALAGADVPATPPEKPKKICRQTEQSLGTHIRSGRQCKTAEQWEADDEARREALPPSANITPGQPDGIPRPERPQP